MDKRYNPNEEVSVTRLKRVDFYAYAELCEQAGYLSTTFDIYLDREI